MKLRACHYNECSDVMTVVFGDGTTRRLSCSGIEATFDMHASARFRLRKRAVYLC